MKLPRPILSVLGVAVITGTYVLWILAFVWAYQFVTDLLSFLLFLAAVLVTGFALFVRTLSDKSVGAAYREFFELFRRE